MYLILVDKTFKDDNINMHPPAKVDLTYGSQTSYIVPNTPLSKCSLTEPTSSPSGPVGIPKKDS